MPVEAILVTHSNADHCGGNSFIQHRTECRIVATRTEAAVIQAPALEPSLLWGGFPLPPLRNKFLMPRQSMVTDTIRPPCAVPGTDVDALPLPGHFLEMAGYMTSDRVFFAADSLAGEEILSKYHVFYLYDVAAHLATLDMLTELDAEWIVPSHAAPTRDVVPLVRANRAKVHEVESVIVELCAQPSTPEQLLARLAEHYGIELNHTQYVLVGSTLRSYLAWLMDRKVLSSRLEKGYLLFERV